MAKSVDRLTACGLLDPPEPDDAEPDPPAQPPSKLPARALAEVPMILRRSPRERPPAKAPAEPYEKPPAKSRAKPNGKPSGSKMRPKSPTDSTGAKPYRTTLSPLPRLLPTPPTDSTSDPKADNQDPQADTQVPQLDDLDLLDANLTITCNGVVFEAPRSVLRRHTDFFEKLLLAKVAARLSATPGGIEIPSDLTKLNLDQYKSLQVRQLLEFIHHRNYGIRSVGGLAVLKTESDLHDAIVPHLAVILFATSIGYREFVACGMNNMIRSMRALSHRTETPSSWRGQLVEFTDLVMSIYFYTGTDGGQVGKNSPLLEYPEKEMLVWGRELCESGNVGVVRAVLLQFLKSLLNHEGEEVDMLNQVVDLGRWMPQRRQVLVEVPEFVADCVAFELT